MKVFNKNSVSVFLTRSLVSLWNHHIFSGVYLVGFFVATVRFFLFSEWLLSYLCSIKWKSVRPQHVVTDELPHQALVQEIKKREGSKGVHRSEVFCSLTCQAHQCKGTSVMSQGARSWSFWSHRDLHRKFLAELLFISIRLGFGPLCLSSWIYLLSFITISNTFSQCLSKHTKALQSTVVVYNVLCHSCL